MTKITITKQKQTRFGDWLLNIVGCLGFVPHQKILLSGSPLREKLVIGCFDNKDIMNFKNSHKSGFTLVELMVSSAIFGLILFSLYYTFNAGMFGCKHIGETIDISYGALRAFEEANSDLRNSFAYFPGGRANFSGTENNMTFFSIGGSGRERGDLTLVSYAVRDGRLLRLLKRNKGCFSAQTSTEILCYGVNGINLSYADYNREKRLLQWKQTWEGSQTMPSAVRIVLDLAGSRQGLEQSFERTVYLPLSSQP